MCEKRYRIQIAPGAIGTFNTLGEVGVDGVVGRMHGCAACYREEVEPRDRIIQELVDAIMDNARHRLLAEGEEGDTVNDFLNMTLNTALAKAKEQLGIEPSNQK